MNDKSKLEQLKDELSASGKVLLKKGDTLVCNSLTKEQKFTQPSPRFTEASLVRELEELGIGRPSTYASIISTLQDRDYVTLEEKHFAPTDLAAWYSASIFLRRVTAGRSVSRRTSSPRRLRISAPISTCGAKSNTTASSPSAAMCASAWSGATSPSGAS